MGNFSNERKIHFWGDVSIQSNRLIGLEGTWVVNFSNERENVLKINQQRRLYI